MIQHWFIYLQGFAILMVYSVFKFLKIFFYLLHFLRLWSKKKLTFELMKTSYIIVISVFDIVVNQCQNVWKKKKVTNFEKMELKYDHFHCFRPTFQKISSRIFLFFVRRFDFFRPTFWFFSSDILHLKNLSPRKINNMKMDEDEWWRWWYILFNSFSVLWFYLLCSWWYQFFYNYNIFIMLCNHIETS